MDASAMWDNGDPTLSGPSQEDYSSFLGMSLGNLSDGLQFDFSDFHSQPDQGTQLMHQTDGDAMDTRMDSGHAIGLPITTMQEPIPSMTTASSHASIQGTPISHSVPSTESLMELDARIQYLQQQRHQQQQRQMQQNYYAQNRLIPPTPNSSEMHGNGHFYSQPGSQQHAIYERYRLKEQEMAFTPLVSPAVTPHETHFHMQEFTVPGAYFSPLSSPAIRAQREQSSLYDQRTSSTTNSPVDMHYESLSAPGSSIIAARRTSKKPPKPRSIRGAKQSPIVKPRKPKKGSSTNLLGQALDDIMEPLESQVSRSAAATSSTASTESENGSISPEHLSDMAPPPIPAPSSITKSPYIPSQNENARPQPPSLVLGPPATPASLMRLTQSPQLHDPAQGMDFDQSMEGFTLPEAATTHKPVNLRIETMSDGQMTPTLASSGQKTPGFQPLPSPAFTRPPTVASASQSPQIDALNGTTNVPPRKNPLLVTRNSKKRSSGSVLASPALLPKFSPNIKPLLPGAKAGAEETASFLLTTKSNYQNIIEGTNPPGVSYPQELSTNLTSKRTSHKLAEQGRRNRINTALQEIATLLPKANSGGGKDVTSGGEKSGSGEGGGGGENGTGNGKDGNAGAQSANSKASTVEHAIDYIKQLKKDLEEATTRAEEAERSLLEKEKANGHGGAIEMELDKR